jgi:hypothetical protein
MECKYINKYWTESELYGVYTKLSTGIMKRIILPILILIRLLTNDGFFNENRNIKIKQQAGEIIRFIKRPANKGRKRFR